MTTNHQEYKFNGLIMKTIGKNSAPKTSHQIFNIFEKIVLSKIGKTKNTLVTRNYIIHVQST